MIGFRTGEAHPPFDKTITAARLTCVCAANIQVFNTFMEAFQAAAGPEGDQLQVGGTSVSVAPFPASEKWDGILKKIDRHRKYA